MTEPDNTPAQTPTPLESRLAALEASGADRFDPVRFRYIRAMARRSRQQRSPVALVVAERALAALATYETDLARVGDRATEMAGQITARCPGAVGTMPELLQAQDFRAVPRRGARLARGTKAGLLSELLRHLDHAQTRGGENSESVPVSELLRIQEDAALEQYFAVEDAPGFPHASVGELRSARLIRDALERRGADTLVSRVAAEAPEDSGPLNPQRLAISSLAAMRDLSPRYLRRFVNHVDTLLWLEQAGQAGKS